MSQFQSMRASAGLVTADQSHAMKLTIAHLHTWPLVVLTKHAAAA